ncbi:MAG: phosphopantetheine-binding protein [Alphaproteobacteria bacterium]|jgi:acyl carrier protein|nr:phosphopantetheine-binding protein [Alphaproteobacteria bacterium]
MTDIEADLKTMIVEILGLEDVRPEDIGSEENLFDDSGLALDSIDALELGVSIQKKYGIKIDPQDKSINEHFKSVRSLADFINKGK